MPQGTKRHKYYYASGQATVYKGLLKINQGTIDTSFAILVDDNTGEIIRIVTLQPTGKEKAVARSTGDVTETTTVEGDTIYQIEPVQHGIDVYDIHPTDTWEEAQALVMKFAKRF